MKAVSFVFLALVMCAMARYCESSEYSGLDDFTGYFSYPVGYGEPDEESSMWWPPDEPPAGMYTTPSTGMPANSNGVTSINLVLDRFLALQSMRERFANPTWDPEDGQPYAREIDFLNPYSYADDRKLIPNGRTFTADTFNGVLSRISEFLGYDYPGMQFNMQSFFATPNYCPLVTEFAGDAFTPGTYTEPPCGTISALPFCGYTKFVCLNVEGSTYLHPVLTDYVTALGGGSLTGPTVVDSALEDYIFPPGTTNYIENCELRKIRPEDPGPPLVAAPWKSMVKLAKSMNGWIAGYNINEDALVQSIGRKMIIKRDYILKISGDATPTLTISNSVQNAVVTNSSRLCELTAPSTSGEIVSVVNGYSVCDFTEQLVEGSNWELVSQKHVDVPNFLNQLYPGYTINTYKANTKNYLVRSNTVWDGVPRENVIGSRTEISVNVNGHVFVVDGGDELRLLGESSYLRDVSKYHDTGNLFWGGKSTTLRSGNAIDDSHPENVVKYHVFSDILYSEDAYDIRNAFSRFDNYYADTDELEEEIGDAEREFWSVVPTIETSQTGTIGGMTTGTKMRYRCELIPDADPGRPRYYRFDDTKSCECGIPGCTCSGSVRCETCSEAFCTCCGDPSSEGSPVGGDGDDSSEGGWGRCYEEGDTFRLINRASIKITVKFDNDGSSRIERKIDKPAVLVFGVIKTD